MTKKTKSKGGGLREKATAAAQQRLNEAANDPRIMQMAGGHVKDLAGRVQAFVAEDPVAGRKFYTDENGKAKKVWGIPLSDLP